MTKKSLKKLLLLLVALTAVICSTFALSACDEINFFDNGTASDEGVTSDDGTLLYILSVDGTYYIICGVVDNTVTEIIVPSTYNDLPVSAIEPYAFSDCTSLTSVTIGDNVVTICEFAFYNTAYYNDSSNWSDSVLYIGTYLIEADTSISGNYKIKDGTKVIACQAFWNCTLLTSVTIPDSVTTIGYEAFSECTSLTSITIPDSVTEIGDSAFIACSSLENIIIPDGVTTIGGYTFYNCRSLESITIPDSVTSIGDSAFISCTSLTRINSETDGEFIIPDGVTSIGENAFWGCTSLTSITIPDNVISIGSNVFLSCSSLANITVNSGNTVYKSIDGNLYSYDGKTLIQYAIGKTDISFTISDNVTEIGNSAFRNCSSLTGITIPDSVTSIGDSAFIACSSLENIIIPDGVTSIGGYTFYQCTSLTSIAIPDSVTTIGLSAFDGCTSLTSVYYNGTESEWSNISIDSYNTYLTDATIYYYAESGSTTVAGNYWYYDNDGNIKTWSVG